MGKKTEETPVRTGSTGRSFAPMDPERQREVEADIEIAGRGAERAPERTRDARAKRPQPEREPPGHYEGSSSRRSR